MFIDIRETMAICSPLAQERCATWINSLEEPYYLSIADPPPVYLSYILGPEWRSQVIIPQKDASNTEAKSYKTGDGYSSIPRPDLTASDRDEVEHCLRMKRCGALQIDQHDHDVPVDLTDRRIQDTERQIFGWPSTGGVWIFRVTPLGLRPDPTDLDSEEWLYAQIEAVEEEERGDPEKERIKALKSEIVRQKNMDEVCEVLEHAGAQYYKQIENCPEVASMGLLSPEI